MLSPFLFFMHCCAKPHMVFRFYCTFVLQCSTISFMHCCAKPHMVFRFYCTWFYLFTHCCVGYNTSHCCASLFNFITSHCCALQLSLQLFSQQKKLSYIYDNKRNLHHVLTCHASVKEIIKIKCFYQLLLVPILPHK